MKTELIKAEEKTITKYPYLAESNHGHKAIFIAPRKGVWLDGNENDNDFTETEESKFIPLPKGSKIILTQE